MMSLVINLMIIAIFIGCFLDVNFNANIIPKNKRKEKGWLNINGKKIF